MLSNLRFAVPALLCLTAASVAAENNMQSSSLITKHDDGVRLTDKAVSGEELLEADLVNIAQPVGTVTDVVLNDAGAIEYLEYSTSVFRDLDGEGYFPVGELDLKPSIPFGIDVDTSGSRAIGMTEQLRLTRGELDQQLLSRILRGHILVEGDSYEIRDVVFDRSGKARYFIVGRTEGGFLQQGDAFAVPFEKTHYVDGAWRTGLPADGLFLLVAYLG